MSTLIHLLIKYMAVAVAVAVSGGVAVPVAVPVALPVAGLTKRFLNQCLGLQPSASRYAKLKMLRKTITLFHFALLNLG